MELKDVIEKRTSIRSFTKEEVPFDDVKEMVRLAGLAPSVNNYQPWDFIAITNRDILHEMAGLISEKYQSLSFKKSDSGENIKKQVEWYSTFFTSAPLVLAVVMQEYTSVLERGTELGHDEINAMRNYPDIQGAGACIQNLLLAAIDLGYGGCWLSGPMIAREDLERILGIESPEKILSFVAIGKPSKDFTPKPKMNLADRMKILS